MWPPPWGCFEPWSSNHQKLTNTFGTKELQQCAQKKWVRQANKYHKVQKSTNKIKLTNISPKAQTKTNNITQRDSPKN